MSLNTTFRQRLLTITCALALATAGLLPAVLGTKHANAAQLSNRKITISSSKVGQTSVTYAVSFNVTSTTTIKGIVVDLCQDSPLIGVACSTTNGVTGTPTGSTINVTGGGTCTAGPTAFTVDATSTGTGLIKLRHATGISGCTAGNTITFSFTATNPTGTASTLGAPGTFYGRILTYAAGDGTASNGIGADDYTSTTPLTHLDDGGVALSTANQLTTLARVQEQLQFCVGGTTVNDATTSIATDCSVAFTGAASCGASGTSIDLGVVDSVAVYTSPVSSATNGNTCNGAAMVRTNAVNGVNISYFAEQDTGSNHLGALRVGGATCNAGVVNTDQCFNSSAAQGAFTAGTEDFGVTVGGVNEGSTTSYSCSYTAAPNTCNLKPAAGYLGQGTSGVNEAYGTANGFKWDETGATQTLASSASVVDDEALVLRFAATANITTPTGSYGVTSTYVATATF